MWVFALLFFLITPRRIGSSVALWNIGVPLGCFRLLSVAFYCFRRSRIREMDRTWTLRRGHWFMLRAGRCDIYRHESIYASTSLVSILLIFPAVICECWFLDVFSVVWRPVCVDFWLYWQVCPFGDCAGGTSFRESFSLTGAKQMNFYNQSPGIRRGDGIFWISGIHEQHSCVLLYFIVPLSVGILFFYVFSLFFGFLF